MSTSPKRAEDRPLHDDVRFLSSALGDVIRTLEGEPAFLAVEGLRQKARARRREEDGAPSFDELLDQVRAMPLEQTNVVARAFTLFFLLINTAEQVHRVRRRRARERDDAQPGSLTWALEQLSARGVSADRVIEAVGELDIRPVLTAHPTEPTRRTVLTAQARVAETLLQRDTARGDSRRQLDAELRAEVELLWLTSETRRGKLEVTDEVNTVRWYLTNRLMPAMAKTHERLSHEVERIFGVATDANVLSVGSWVGGDRDGNPFVTPALTLRAARHNKHGVLHAYAKRVRELFKTLSLSTSICGSHEPLLRSIEDDAKLAPEVIELQGRLLDDEPVRLKLRFVRARLEATRDLVAAQDRGGGAVDPRAYASSDELVADLELIADAMKAAGATVAVARTVQPFIALVRRHGFFGFLVDVREDSSVHERALTEIAAVADATLAAREDLHRELTGSRPLVSPHRALGAEADKALGVFRSIATVQRELGEEAASTYIISMARSVDDLLRVLLLAREAGLVDLASEPARSSIDVVPLFETLDDLENAPRELRALYTDPLYRKQLAVRGNRQEVMLGYSDSAKDAGVLPAAWALYRAQHQLAEISREHGVALTMFHGRGGTVGRGGGSPVYRALSALPVGSLKGSIKITEQGEVISQKFSIGEIAERSLDVMVAGTLMAGFDDWRERSSPGEIETFHGMMDRAAELALPVFKDLVHRGTDLFELFMNATPTRALALAHFGSRPAYRERGAGTMAGIRAIPWVFGWTQIRLMLPAWLGVGTALEGLTREFGAANVARMSQVWPFFDDLLGKIEMVCAKTDTEIARAYIGSLAPNQALTDELLAELDRTVNAIVEIRGRSLLADQPLLKTSIDLRDPYLDPLSLLQIRLLEESRGEHDAETRALIDSGLSTTLSGIAHGLRNTG